MNSWIILHDLNRVEIFNRGSPNIDSQKMSFEQWKLLKVQGYSRHPPKFTDSGYKKLRSGKIRKIHIKLFSVEKLIFKILKLEVTPG